MIDTYLSDLGVGRKPSSTSPTPNTDSQNVILDYVIDVTSEAINAGDPLTFISDHVKKASASDVVYAISLKAGIAGETIQCQVSGIVSVSSAFIAGTKYPYGFAITNSELVLSI